MAADFEKTYQEYQQMIHAFLLRLCGNAHLAEELTQETFYQAFKHWGKFRGQSSISTWLCKIAKNQLQGKNLWRLSDEYGMASSNDHMREAKWQDLQR